MPRNFAYLLPIAVLLVLAMPHAGFAQYSDPPSFSITPTVINQGDCYTIRVPNWPGAVLNIRYYTDWTGYEDLWGWPSMDGNGNALICSNSSTVVGTYTFVLAGNNYAQPMWSIYATITVNAPAAAAAQPSSLTFNPTEGYAGMACYIMTMGNAANMTVDLRYTFNGALQQDWMTAMNFMGQWQYCVNHHDRAGTYVFNYMKNHQAAEFVSVNPPATYLVRPPQPQSLTVGPAVILQGLQPYTMTAVNGAGVTLDLQYTLNGEPHTITGWPTLAPADGDYSYNGSWDGSINIATDGSTPLGKYVFTAYKNSLNTTWVTIPGPGAPLNVCPNAAPVTTSIVPTSAARGSSVSVTINGANLCYVWRLMTSLSGVTFTNVTWDYPFTRVMATLNVATDAPLGAGTIQASTQTGTTSALNFWISPPVGLTREYIRLGERVIAVETP